MGFWDNASNMITGAFGSGGSFWKPGQKIAGWLGGNGTQQYQDQLGMLGQAPAPQVSFRIGDDVTHPKFGEGVVTGVEPGGIVVIHFGRDGTDRKLVADLAPISKRS